MEAIKTMSFLYDECPQSIDDECPNKKQYQNEYKVQVKPEHYVQFGRIRFVTNKRTHVKKNDTRGTAMMMVGYALNSPSGTYRMYNVQTRAMIETNSVGWKDFTKGEAESVSALKKQFHEPEAGGKMTIDDNDDDDVRNNNDLVQSAASSTAAAQSSNANSPPSCRVTRSITAASRTAESTATNVTSGTNTPSATAPNLEAPTDPHARTPNFTVTGNTAPTQLTFDTDVSSIHHLYTPELIASFEK